MKSPIPAAIGSLLIAAAQTIRGDATWVYAVQITASIQTSPPQIILHWEPDNFGANNYTIYRKAKEASSWGAGTTLPGTVTSFVDNNVAVGSAYEYAIVKAGTLGYTGYGYIYAGLNAPLVESRGTVVLVVDNTYTSQLAGELVRLQSDLVGDGWTVARRDVSRNDSPASVRSAIQSVYYSDPGNVKAVFLFGHVPILRSGNLNVDGHQARPMPADPYYGDMDGSWNNPSFLPSDVELMVGRVDLFNMPGNGAASPWPSELELLRNYLNKDHNWRHKLISVPRRALLGNRFGDFGGEAFAASGFRNFSPFVGSGNIVLANEQDSASAEQKWSSMLVAGTYLWAYGCGGGTYVSMSGMGTHGTYGDIWSTDIVGGNAKAVFFMMFGSWLGEWDGTDDIMRSVLATPTMGLSCSWAGRPHWFYHHMGLGEPIGYCARLTQNNGGLYQNYVNQNMRGVHIALMGDPTLRLHQVAPPSGLSSSSSSGGVSLSWGASRDSVLGYYVYRSASAAGPFARISGSLVTGTSFVDTTAAGASAYMVRAVKLEDTASGTYYNASQGAFAGDTGNSGNSGNNPPPSGTVTLTAPSNGSTVSGGSVIVSASVPGAGIAGVQFELDGVNLGPEDASAPYSVSWDSKLAANGSHRLVAVARNAGGVLTSSAEIAVTVNNSSVPVDTPAGNVALSAPANGTTVSGGSVIVSANVSGIANLAGVQFKLDGVNLGPEDTSAPYSISWDSKLAANGSHRLAAMARDSAGALKASAEVIVAVNNSASSAPPTNTVIWVDDGLPSGAVPGATGGDAWTWISSNPAPFSGKAASQSSLATGYHQHYFDWAANTLTVNAGEVLFAYIYLDPVNPPSEAMLQWEDGIWEHRAYWGANNIALGSDGTSARFYAGPLPAAGRWARLEVRASQVGLEGRTVRGLAFTLCDGRATWDAAGKSTQATAPLPVADKTPPIVAITAPLNNASLSGASAAVSANASDNVRVAGVQFKLDGANLGTEDPAAPYTATFNPASLANGAHYLAAVARDAASNFSTSAVVTVFVGGAKPSGNDTVWFDDTLPDGAASGADGGDSWNWVANNPAPFSGAVAHQSNLGAGSHQHFFRFARNKFVVNSGEVLFAYVYLDPINPPSEIMLQWNDGSWEHRAYWGANLANYGVNATTSRAFIGPLPAKGQWVRLEVPARLVGLEGSSLEGIAFTLFGGRATWDKTGKRSF